MVHTDPMIVILWGLSVMWTVSPITFYTLCGLLGHDFPTPLPSRRLPAETRMYLLSVADAFGVKGTMVLYLGLLASLSFSLSCHLRCFKGFLI